MLQEKWFFEDFVGQDTSNFDYVGVCNKEPEKITNIDAQVKELHRKYGNSTLIRVYNSRELLNA